MEESMMRTEFLYIGGLGLSCVALCCIAAVTAFGQPGGEPTPVCHDDVCFEFDCLKVAADCLKYERTTAIKMRDYWVPGITDGGTHVTTGQPVEISLVSTCTKSCVGKTNSIATNCSSETLEPRGTDTLGYCGNDPLP
jgi:hypothetical protein